MRSGLGVPFPAGEVVLPALRCDPALPVCGRRVTGDRVVLVNREAALEQPIHPVAVAAEQGRKAGAVDLAGDVAAVEDRLWLPSPSVLRVGEEDLGGGVPLRPVPAFRGVTGGGGGGDDQG